MSTIRKPTLGPIVGHTTHASSRLWISALDPEHLGRSRDSENRTIGVIAVATRSSGQQTPTVKPEYIYYFRLRREYDRSGSFNLGVDTGLWEGHDGKTPSDVFEMTPNKVYVVRMAVLNVDDAFPDDYNVLDSRIGVRLPNPAIWVDVFNDSSSDGYVEAEFTTFPRPPANGKAKNNISFLLGSCRYPGLLWKAKLSDRIFGPMLQEHKIKPMQDQDLRKTTPPVRFVVMAGDQIYADMLNRYIPVGLADTYEEFQERYHTSFGSTNMREILRQIPTYMILDDHEIEDNWSQDRIDKNRGKRVLFNMAIGAYMSYQWNHGPRTWNNCYELSGTSGMSVSEKCLHTPQTALLYYDFLCDGYPFFTLDTRTQRFKNEDDDKIEENHLLGLPSQDSTEPGQLDRLLNWLIHQQQRRGDTPKFIVSSSVFVPNPLRSTRSDEKKAATDSWPAFPTTRRKLLDCIVENGIQNLVFLSGDIHNSNVARLRFKDGPGDNLSAYSITSSAFYWPFSFADGDPSHYVHDANNADSTDVFKLSEGNGTMSYKAWGFTQKDNFCRIDIDRDASEIGVSMIDDKGEAIRTKKAGGAYNTSPQRLKLSNW